MLEITVTSDEGKRVERVTFSKNGDIYVAKRENEPALYELTSSSVTDIQKAVAEIKPATAKPPSAPKK